TTSAPSTASASPSPVIVLTPVSGDAATASWPASRSFVTSFDPMRPVPPMTTIFISSPFVVVSRPSGGADRVPLSGVDRGGAGARSSPPTRQPPTPVARRAGRAAGTGDLAGVAADATAPQPRRSSADRIRYPHGGFRARVEAAAGAREEDEMSTNLS